MVIRTFNIELIMDDNVRTHWLTLLTDARDAYNFCAELVAEKHVPLTLKAFHDTCYAKARERFDNLPAQAVIKVYKDLMGAMRSIRKNKHKKHKTPHKYGLSLQLDRHLYTRVSREGVVLSSGEGRKRVLCPFVLYDKAREMFDTCVTKDPLIFSRDGRMFLSVPFEERSMPCRGNSAVGVDLGVRRLFVTSEGVAFSDKEYLKRRRRLRYLKRCLQGKGTKSAKRHLRKLSRKERNMSKEHVIKACNALVGSTSADVLVLEDLSKIKSNTSKNGYGFKRKRHNNVLSQVPFYMFKERLSHKAALAGKQVVSVSASFTSQTDSRTNKRDGVRNGCRYRCSDGTVFDADWNAAVNIAKRSNLPLSSDILPLDGGLSFLCGKAVSTASTPATSQWLGKPTYFSRG